MMYQKKLNRPDRPRKNIPVPNISDKRGHYKKANLRPKPEPVVTVPHKRLQTPAPHKSASEIRALKIKPSQERYKAPVLSKPLVDEELISETLPETPKKRVYKPFI